MWYFYQNKIDKTTEGKGGSDTELWRKSLYQQKIDFKANKTASTTLNVWLYNDYGRLRIVSWGDYVVQPPTVIVQQFYLSLQQVTFLLLTTLPLKLW